MEETNNLSPHLREFLARLSIMFNKQARKKGLEFNPTASDVIISTGAKSGTTWLQQICHGLRSGGSMEFEEISLVIPCLEMADCYGYDDLQAPQQFSPRMYKTHLWYPQCPKGAGKYIIVVRQPRDVACSFFWFFNNWIFQSGTISADEFVEQFYLKRGAPKSWMENSSQIHHIWSWYPHRHDENVLWLHFEDLQQDLRECIRLIADFLDIGSGDEKLHELVLNQASFEFMKQHRNKFDEHPIKLARNEYGGLPKNAGLTGNCGKVRAGGKDKAEDLLSEPTLLKIEQKWKAIMASDTGYESYDDMRKGINIELGRKFT